MIDYKPKIDEIKENVMPQTFSDYLIMFYGMHPTDPDFKNLEPQYRLKIMDEYAELIERNRKERN